MNKNKSKLNKKLRLESWDYLFNSENIQLAYTYFHNQIKYMYEECFPESRIQITYTNRLPWMTNSIRTSIKQKIIYTQYMLITLPRKITLNIKHIKIS